MLTGTSVFGQAPVINTVEEANGPVNLEIGISGTGFNATAANLKVRFGGAEAEITSASTTYLQVKIPAGTSTFSISVTNLVSGLTGYSSKIFFINFNGDGAAQGIVDVTPIASPLELFDLEIADFDQDGKNDIVVTKIDNNARDISIYHNTSTTNSISFNILDRTTNTELDIADPSSGIAYGDIDGDGKLDFVITRAGDSRTEISVFRNTSTVGNIKFAAAKSYFVNASHLTKNIKVKDLDRDGKPEVIVTNTINNELSIFKNNSTKGNINLSFVPTIIQVGDAPNTSGLAVEDIDNDGKPDLVIIPFLDRDVYIMRNQSTSSGFSFADPVVLAVEGNLNGVVVGDLNNDGKNDIIVSKTVQNEIAVLINTSTTGISFEAPVLFASNQSPWGLDLVDFDGNGLLDIMVTSTTGSNFTYFQNESTGSLILTKKDYAQTNQSRSVKSGDLSNDGKPDIVITSFNTISKTFDLVIVRNNFCFQPSILQGADLTICNGQTIRLDATTALDVTYVWSRNGTDVKTSTDPFYDITLPGEYIVTATTESNNCIIASAKLTASTDAATAPADPVASNNGPGCIGNNITLSTPTVANVAYEWIGPNGFTSLDQNPVLSAVTVDLAGTYEVLLVNAQGCKSTNAGTTLVEVVAPPDFTIGSTDPSEFCEGGSATLSVDAVTGYTYQWTLDNIPIAGATATSYTATLKGNYNMVATSTVFSCEVTSDLYPITTIAPPVAMFTSDDAFCSNSPIVFTNASTVDSAIPVTYSWILGDGTTSTEIDSVVHTYSSAGSYTVSLTVDYTGLSCSDTFTLMIDVNEATPFMIQLNGSIPFCEGDSVELSVPGTYTSYLWNDGSTSSTLIAKVSGTYSVDATNANGCISSDQIDVTTFPLPVVVIAADRDAITLGESIQLIATGALDYIWTPGESLSDSTISDPIATPLATTTYLSTGTDINGCIGSSEFTLSVSDAGNELPVVAPRLFSPNNDSIDDFWVIENMLNFPNCKIVVFDRNGSTVFEAEPYLNDWDGTNLSGDPVAEGPYFFVISCDDGKSSNGSVSIIR